MIFISGDYTDPVNTIELKLYTERDSLIGSEDVIRSVSIYVLTMTVSPGYAWK